MGCLVSTQVHNQNSEKNGSNNYELVQSKSKSNSDILNSQEFDLQNPSSYMTVSDSYLNQYISFSNFIEQKDPCLFQYRIIKQIGHGSHAAVYEAINTETNVKYACKVYDRSLLTKQSISTESPLQMMLTEIEIMSTQIAFSLKKS